MIDGIRGLAIVNMVVFYFLYDKKDMNSDGKTSENTDWKGQ